MDVKLKKSYGKISRRLIVQQDSRYLSPLYTALTAVWANFVKTVPKIEPKY